ncbi:MAG: hypothetical protein JNM17_10695 [Archangium sp.]|nr:hypothetical protein [Archangium sp.]
MVSNLVEARVVELADAPGDARGTRVRLAKHAPLHDGAEVLARLERRLTKGLGARQRKALETALNTLLTNLGEAR